MAYSITLIDWDFDSCPSYVNHSSTPKLLAFGNTIAMAAFPRNSHLLSHVRLHDEIEVWWPDDKKYYPGTVGLVLPSGKHRIFYTDGEVEDLSLSKEQWRFCGRAADRFVSPNSRPPDADFSESGHPPPPPPSPHPTVQTVRPIAPAPTLIEQAPLPSQTKPKNSISKSPSQGPSLQTFTSRNRGRPFTQKTKPVQSVLSNRAANESNSSKITFKSGIVLPNSQVKQKPLPPLLTSYTPAVVTKPASVTQEARHNAELAPIPPPTQPVKRLVKVLQPAPAKSPVEVDSVIGNQEKRRVLSLAKPKGAAKQSDSHGKSAASVEKLRGGNLDSSIQGSHAITASSSVAPVPSRSAPPSSTPARSGFLLQQSRSPSSQQRQVPKFQAPQPPHNHAVPKVTHPNPQRLPALVTPATQVLSSVPQRPTLMAPSPVVDRSMRCKQSETRSQLNARAQSAPPFKRGKMNQPSESNPVPFVSEMYIARSSVPLQRRLSGSISKSNSSQSATRLSSRAQSAFQQDSLGLQSKDNHAKAIVLSKNETGGSSKLHGNASDKPSSNASTGVVSLVATPKATATPAAGELQNKKAPACRTSHQGRLSNKGKGNFVAKKIVTGSKESAFLPSLSALHNLKNIHILGPIKSSVANVPVIPPVAQQISPRFVANRVPTESPVNRLPMPLPMPLPIWKSRRKERQNPAKDKETTDTGTNTAEGCISREERIPRKGKEPLQSKTSLNSLPVSTIYPIQFNPVPTSTFVPPHVPFRSPSKAPTSTRSPAAMRKAESKDLIIKPASSGYFEAHSKDTLSPADVSMKDHSSLPGMDRSPPDSVLLAKESVRGSQISSGKPSVQSKVALETAIERSYPNSARTMNSKPVVAPRVPVASFNKSLTRDKPHDKGSVSTSVFNQAKEPVAKQRPQIVCETLATVDPSSNPDQSKRPQMPGLSPSSRGKRKEAVQGQDSIPEMRSQEVQKLTTSQPDPKSATDSIQQSHSKAQCTISPNIDASLLQPSPAPSARNMENLHVEESLPRNGSICTHRMEGKEVERTSGGLIKSVRSRLPKSSIGSVRTKPRVGHSGERRRLLPFQPTKVHTMEDDGIEEVPVQSDNTVQQSADVPIVQSPTRGSRIFCAKRLAEDIPPNVSKKSKLSEDNGRTERPFPKPMIQETRSTDQKTGASCTPSSTTQAPNISLSGNLQLPPSSDKIVVADLPHRKSQDGNVVDLSFLGNKKLVVPVKAGQVGTGGKLEGNKNQVVKSVLIASSTPSGVKEKLGSPPINTPPAILANNHTEADMLNKKEKNPHIDIKGNALEKDSVANPKRPRSPTLQKISSNSKSPLVGASKAALVRASEKRGQPLSSAMSLTGERSTIQEKVVPTSSFQERNPVKSHTIAPSVLQSSHVRRIPIVKGSGAVVRPLPNGIPSIPGQQGQHTAQKHPPSKVVTKPGLPSAPSTALTGRLKGTQGIVRSKPGGRITQNIERGTASLPLDILMRTITESNVHALHSRLAPLSGRIDKMFSETRKEVENSRAELLAKIDAIRNNGGRMEEKLDLLTSAVHKNITESRLGQVLESHSTEIRTSIIDNIDQTAVQMKIDLSQSFIGEVKKAIREIASEIQRDSIMMISKAIDAAINAAANHQTPTASLDGMGVIGLDQSDAVPNVIPSPLNGAEKVKNNLDDVPVVHRFEQGLMQMPSQLSPEMHQPSMPTVGKPNASEIALKVDHPTDAAMVYLSRASTSAGHIGETIENRCAPDNVAKGGTEREAFPNVEMARKIQYKHTSNENVASRKEAKQVSRRHSVVPDFSGRPGNSEIEESIYPIRSTFQNKSGQYGSNEGSKQFDCQPPVKVHDSPSEHLPSKAPSKSRAAPQTSGEFVGVNNVPFRQEQGNDEYYRAVTCQNVATSNSNLQIPSHMKDFPERIPRKNVVVEEKPRRMSSSDIRPSPSLVRRQSDKNVRIQNPHLRSSSTSRLHKPNVRHSSFNQSSRTISVERAAAAQGSVRGGSGFRDKFVRQVRELMGVCLLKWLLGGGCRRSAPENEREKAVSQEWVFRTCKSCLIDSLQRLLVFTTHEEALEGLAEGMTWANVNLEWITIGATPLYLDRARTNYVSWDPKLLDFEWNSERRVLICLSRDVLKSEQSLVIENVMMVNVLQSAVDVFRRTIQLYVDREQMRS